MLRRALTTAAKKTKLTIGLIPADGIGKEVTPVYYQALKTTAMWIQIHSVLNNFYTLGCCCSSRIT